MTIAVFFASSNVVLGLLVPIPTLPAKSCTNADGKLLGPTFSLRRVLPKTMEGSGVTACESNAVRISVTVLSNY